MLHAITQTITRKFNIHPTTSNHDHDLFDAIDQITNGVSDLRWLAASAPKQTTREAAQEVLNILAERLQITA